MIIKCSYCGTDIQLNPGVVAQIQKFSKRYKAGDACVKCRSTFIKSYIGEYEKKDKELKSYMEDFTQKTLKVK